MAYASVRYVEVRCWGQVDVRAAVAVREWCVFAEQAGVSGDVVAEIAETLGDFRPM